MANVGTGAAGKTLIGAGNGASPTYASIGTNSGLTAHGLVVAEGNSAFSIVGPSSTSGTILQSAGAASDPVYSTATYPSTTTINQILYSSSSNVVSGLATSNTSVLTTSGAGVPGYTAYASTGGTYGGTSNIVARDSNGNAAFNNTIDGQTSSAAGSTYTLTAASTRTQIINGVGATTIVLPNATTLINGHTFYLNNNSNAVVTVQYQDTTTLFTIPRSGYVQLILTSNATANGTWDYHWLIPSNLTDGQVMIGSSAGGPAASTLTAGTGVSITNGNNSITVAASASVPTTFNANSGSATPSANALTINGGTTGLTTSGSGSTISLTGTLALANGGTNANLTASNGGIFYSTASAGAILSGTATAGQILRSGATAAPTWSTATYPATSGTSGNILKSDGTNWVSSSPSSSGASLTLLSTQNPSNVASLAFTSLITTSYKTYLLVFNNLVPATSNAKLQLQVSANNGSTYVNSGYLSGLNSLAYNGTTNNNSNSTSAFLLTDAITTSAGTASGCGWCYLYNVDIAVNCFLSGQSVSAQGASNIVFATFGGIVTTSSVNAFQVLFTSGNITSGTFSLYGISF